MANTDLQQWNAPQYWPEAADVGTNADPYLIPVDGKFITADSNLNNQAPINVSQRVDKQLYMGLRAATIGDFTGAIRKTFKSIHVDALAGVTSTIPAGTIQASGDITSTAGNVISTVGDLLAPGGSCTVDQNVTAGAAVVSDGGLVISGNAVGEHAELTEALLKYFNTGTGSGDANPPQGTAIANQMRAKNIPKTSLFIDVAPGVVNSFEGFGIQSVVINAGDSKILDITFAAGFDNGSYSLKSGATRDGAAAVLALPFERVDMRTNTTCSVQVWSIVAGTPVDFALTGVKFSLDIDGQQTT